MGSKLDYRVFGEDEDSFDIGREEKSRKLRQKKTRPEDNAWRRDDGKRSRRKFRRPDDHG
jgi:hypothetical protein